LRVFRPTEAALFAVIVIGAVAGVFGLVSESIQI
jgi:arginine:ornithine antiporter / lysine permease